MGQLFGISGGQTARSGRSGPEDPLQNAYSAQHWLLRCEFSCMFTVNREMFGWDET